MGSSTLGKFLAEFIGTFSIVFFGAGSVCVSGMNASLGLVGISLTFGLIVAVMVSALGHVSGAHFNPAVTILCLVTRRITPSLAGVYVAAQLVGAVVAAFALRLVIAEKYWGNLGTTTLAGSGLTPMAGLVVEFILTFFLVLVIFGTAIDPRGSKLGAVAIGAVVCLDILVGGPLTGASMNPARTFGPALVSGTWADHWVYWAGPILGALAATFVYEKVLAPPAKLEVASGVSPRKAPEGPLQEAKT